MWPEVLSDKESLQSNSLEGSYMVSDVLYR